MLNDRTMDRYLHAILLLGTRFLVVRAVDIATWLEYSKASVSVAVMTTTIKQANSEIRIFADFFIAHLCFAMG